MVRRGGIDDPRRLRWPPSGTADPLTARSCPDLVVTILFPDLDSTGKPLCGQNVKTPDLRYLAVTV